MKSSETTNKTNSSRKKTILKIIVICALFAAVLGIPNIAYNIRYSNMPICDGATVTTNCKDQDGKTYSKYIYHEAQDKKTHIRHHEATPEVYHIVHHEAEYGTRQVRDCVRTTISYKNGTCAQSKCADGSYSGSSGRGTCSYHGGVVARGPWYTTRTETYVVKEAWDEKVVDKPAKEAYDEEVVDSPAREAYWEKERMH